MSKKQRKEDKKEDVLKKEVVSDKNLEKELESWEKDLKFEDGLPQEY